VVNAVDRCARDMTDASAFFAPISPHMEEGGTEGRSEVLDISVHPST
jgi:hypothetical protein